MMPSSSKKEHCPKIKLVIGNDVSSPSGSSAKGQIEPSIGHLDMGESDDAYLFRIALPGVKNDEDFSCVVERDGNVHIKGVATTGEDTVVFHALKFVMKSKNLCPPGEFSIQFHLPGPVNPQQFKGSFKDGILEGVVMKQKNRESLVNNNVSAA